MYGWDFDLWKMSWMLSVWVATALLALCRGQNTAPEGNSLSESGYHLCVHNETRNVSFLVMHTVPYTVTKPCGGWLHWKTCTVTLYRMTHQTEQKMVMEQVIGCCSGYEQVGRYCARPVNRSAELTAKPGSCPTADGLCPRSEDCKWDMDCPGWQRCCRFLCTDPTSSADYSENGGYQFNATVTVKTDYLPLMSSERGLLNHTRLLQAMVTGALQSDVSVYYLSSQHVHPYRTATSLLIGCNFSLSLHDVTSKLHHLLKHIQEVTSVSVEDVDECAQSALHQCSLHADCNNTVGSFRCACHQGFIDIDPRNPGAHCTADLRPTTTTEPPLTSLTPTNTPHTPASNSTQEDPLSMSSTAEPPLPTTACSPPSITSAWSANVTATSFDVYWSSRCQTIQTYEVVLRRRSEVIQSWMTNQTVVEVRDLQPGLLYNVTITPCSCGSQGVALGISVKTDAQTLDATARLTNIKFTPDLRNTSSQAYENLTESIREEIYQTLSPEMKAMVDSGQVRIDIRSFSKGSVVVNFTIVLAPSQSQDINNVSTALLHSLMNSTKYTVDKNNTSTNDFNECASGENDCSQWAICTNTWASYKCVCLDGSIDNNPERPGRACQEIATTTTAPTANNTAPTANNTTLTPTANNTAPTANNTAPTANNTTLTPTANNTAPTANNTAPIANNTAPTPTAINTAPTTNITAPTTNNTAPTANNTAPEITTTTTPITSTAPTTTTTTPITSTAPTTTTTTPITFTAPTTTITTLITSTAPTTTTTTPITSTAPTITTTTPITSTAPTTTTTTLITSTAPITTTTTPITSTAPTTTTTTLITSTAPTTTTTTPITSTAPTTTTATPITSTAPTITTTTPITSTAPTITTTTPITSTAPTITTTTPITSTAPTTTTTTPITSTAPTITTTTPITSTAPTTTTTTPITSTAPTTTTTTPITSTAPTTTTTTTATATAMISITSTPTVIVASPTTTIRAPVTTATSIRTATNVSMLGAISVQCRVATITVTVAKNFLLSNKIREHTLYLGLPECTVNGGNTSHVQLTVAWNECDTSVVHNETYYMASVTLFNTMGIYTSENKDVEVPRIRLEAPITCTYMKSMLLSADSGSMGYDIIKDVITGSGSFQVTVQLMNGTMPLPNNHSLSSDEAVVLEVSLNPSSEQFKVVVNKCWATPTPTPTQNPKDTNNLTFLANSCSLNKYTKVLMNGKSSTSRVSVQIFSIVDLDLIYLHCLVQICVETGSDTCVPNCLKKTARSPRIIGIAVNSSKALLRSYDESLEEGFSILYIAGFSCLGVGLTLFFVIGFVCILYFHRNRIGHYNFSTKPKEETFTYLVFNT